jgi:hypothetical protein
VDHQPPRSPHRRPDHPAQPVQNPQPAAERHRPPRHRIRRYQRAHPDPQQRPCRRKRLPHQSPQNARCSAAPTSTCSGKGSCSTHDTTQSHQFTIFVPEPLSRGHGHSTGPVATRHPGGRYWQAGFTLLPGGSARREAPGRRGLEQEPLSAAALLCSTGDRRQNFMPGVPRT